MMRSSGRILFLVENNPYPFDVRVRREAHALRDAGFRVAVISPRRRDQRSHERVDGVSVYRFSYPPQGSGLLSYAFEFGYATVAMWFLSIWVAVTHGFDVVHAANPPDTLFLIGAFFKLFGKQFVFDHHDLAPETYLSRFDHVRPDKVYRALLSLEHCSFAVADAVIATNESYRRIAIDRGGKQPDRIFVVRNGPPLSFKPVPPEPELEVRASYIIGYIGTMGPQDGVDYWLRAIHALVYSLNRRDFLAVIIGSGDALPGLRTLARDLDIESYVWFTGRISDSDALRYLSTSHLCVHPDPLNSLNDKSTMNKMMEYMALGKAIVSFDLSEARTSAQDAAMYVKPNDTFDFARRVDQLLDHPEERAAMGERGRRRVQEALAWEYSIPQLLAAYAVLGFKQIDPALPGSSN